MAATEPRTAKGRATRERILDAAARLMVECGVGATSLDDVLAEVRVSKGQLYHYFGDKDALVDAVIERTIQGVLDAQPRLADLSTWKAIRGWFDDLVELQVERHARGGCPIGGLASELAEHRESARHDLAEGYGRWEAPLREGLARMQRRGGLRPGADPAKLATATLAAIQGGLILTQTRRDPQQLRIALDAMYGYLRSFAA
jgi:TetR/AcrR family transcriptional regulator, transcriptional repressor for nem operon